MKTVILCGGFGTRIRDVAEDIPKPMIPIGDVPILWHILSYYASWKHSQFVLCLGYKSQVIKDFVLNYETYTSDFTIRLGDGSAPRYHGLSRHPGWEITLADTGQKTMTGARIARVKKYLESEEDFFLTYGDGVGDIDLARLLAFHREHGRILTVTGVRPPGRFGELTYEADGTVKGFNEKPQVSGGRISAGFFVCRRELFDYLPDRDDLVFEQEPMRRLVEAKQLKVFEHDGFWQCMDTARDHAFLNELVEKNRAPWVRW